MNRRHVIVGAAALGACAREAESQAPAAAFPMRRGVNLGNALEAPNEGDWGYRIEADHLSAIRDAGFDGVRLPVRWDRRRAHTPPFAIEPAFLGRVSEVVDWALARGLMVQLDVHHYADLIDSGPTPAAMHRVMFRGLWEEIARHFRDAPAALMFELLNEPHGERWTGAAVAALQSEVIPIIRASNPERLIVLGPGNWQSIDALSDWRPPAGANIAVSVHYYEPHAFTHHGAEWLGAEAPRFGRDWGTDADARAVEQHVAEAADWGARFGYAMQLGEFGVNRAVRVAQRAAWTRAVRQACEAHGMGWCVWDFAGAFPVWDRERGAFIPEMLAALLG